MQSHASLNVLKKVRQDTLGTLEHRLHNNHGWHKKELTDRYKGKGKERKGRKHMKQ